MNEALKAAWHDNTVRMQDEPLTLLAQSYRWYRLRNRAWFSPHGPVRGPIDAVTALRNAREDVEAGKRRYPSESGSAVSWQENENPRSSERLAYVESPEKAGLRLVGRVMAECGGRNGIWDNREDSGWFTDPHGDTFKGGTGLCYGLVYQLPGKGGKARFVAGYQFGGCDDGPMIDFGTVFEEPAAELVFGRYGNYWSWQDNPREMDAALTAARSADHMAKRAAEHEREYQTAWQAGNLYATAKEEIADKRTTCLELLADRRKAHANGLAGYDAICAAIRDKVSGYLSDISDAREKMAKLASGDYQKGETWYGFFTGDARLRAAFNDGAGETVLK